MRHRLEYALVAAFRELARVLPDKAVAAIGTAVGLTFWAIDAAHRRLAVRQLQAAFPLRSEGECRTIARQMFGHFGRLLLAILKFSTLDREAVRKRVEYEGTERVEQALALGRGVLIFSGHFGFWELQGIAHPLALPPMHVLARPLDNPLLHRLLEDARTSTGNGVIYRRGAVRKVMRALAANQTVAVMIDQHIQSADAVYVDFFNRPAATTSALAALALKTGAPVIPVFALPLEDGRYRMIYEHPVPPPAHDSPDPVRELTQHCTDVLEMYVRRYPNLWLWMHRRWRDLPPDVEAVRGMFPAATSEDISE